jgi:phosphomannomutase
MILDSPADYSAMTWDEVKANSLVTKVDLEKDYIDAIRANFDLDAINNSGLKLAFDAMYGSGQRVIRQVLNNVSEFHCEPNPSFMGQAPEPIEKNLQEVSNFLKNNPGYAAALAIDGDADRVGIWVGHFCHVCGVIDSCHCPTAVTGMRVRFVTRASNSLRNKVSAE